MKKILLITFIALISNLKAQVIFEHAYDSASTYATGGPALQDQLMIVNFEISGQQYVKINRHGKKILIYDLNHSLLQTIDYSSFPQAFTANNYCSMLYFSQSLFDTDPGIEFMYIANTSSPYTGIYNDDGSLIFSDTGVALILVSFPTQQYPIYNTTQGTKMILSYQNGKQAKVFGLAGTLSTAIQASNQNLLQASGLVSNPHPNPTNNTATIDYKIPDGANQGEIVFYDLQGTEIKRFKVDKTFNSLLISTTDIPAGTYYYQLQTSGNTSAGKKVVVVK